MHLFIKNLLSCVGVFCHINEVFDSRWIDFFILCRDKKSGYTHKLYFFFFNFVQTHISINQVNSDEECFREQLKFSVHIDNPINKDSSNVFVYLCLTLHVGRIWLSIFFGLLHVQLYLSTVFRDMINVGQCCLVDFRNVTHNVPLISLEAHSYFCTHTDFWQFFSRSDSWITWN